MMSIRTSLPKVSILIPCYNSEKYLAETLNCCLNQTYENIEVVLVDDGSTDMSYLIAVDFSNKYPDSIKVFQQPNLGACRARNLAFEKSTGDFIMYLDADDIMSENKIENQVALLHNSNGSVGTCSWRRFSSSLNQYDSEPCKCAKSYDNAKEMLYDLWEHGEMFAVHSYLVPRQIIEKAGPWREDLKKNQDGEFFSRVLINADKVIFCEHAETFYRTGDYDSVSKDNSRAKVEALLYSFEQYSKNVLPVDDSLQARKALAKNFSLFRYLYYGRYPDLSQRARQSIRDLNVKMPVCGTKRVCQISRIIGFDNFLRLRKLLRNR